MRLPFIALLTLATAPLSAQDFVPPDAATASTGVHLGLFGFGTRIGLDLGGRQQAIGSVALDLGHLFSDRIRVRPSGELGIGNGANTYLMNLELIYRFTSDRETAIPYVGFGLGVWGEAQCSAATDCPAVWPQFALGFELKLRDQINWMLEYHAEDTFSRHRLLIGLTTRRGS